MNEQPENHRRYKGYLGNPYLKKPYVNLQFTAEQVKEYDRCRKDLFYFIENYVKIEIIGKGIKQIKPWPRQWDMFEHLRSHRFNIFKIPRQSSKTTSVAIYYAWCALFNESEKIGIAANNGRLASEIVDKFKVVIEHLPLFLQQGILEYNKGNITLENGSEIRAGATTKSAFRGFSLTKLFLDELAFIENKLAEAFYESVYPTISTAGDRGQLTIASTPKGINNLFYKIWSDAIAGKNDFVPLSLKWDEVPRKDQAKFKETTTRNIGETRWKQEFECLFLSDSGTLISPDALENIVKIDPIEINNNFKKYAEPVRLKKDDLQNIVDPGRVYVSMVDSGEGIGHDYSANVIVDITEKPYQVVGVYQCNTVQPSSYAEMVVELAKYYNNAHLLIENNAIGYAVSESIINDYEYNNIIFTVSAKSGIEKISGGFSRNSSNCLRMTSKTKASGCSALKHLIEGGDLLVNDSGIFTELTSFTRKGNSYEASAGANDDLVMCLVMFGWLTNQEFFRDIISENIGIIETIQENQESEDPEDHITPFGYISSVDDEEEDGFDWNF